MVYPEETTMVQSMMSSAWLNQSHQLQLPGGHPVRKPRPAPGTSTNQDSPWQVVYIHTHMGSILINIMLDSWFWVIQQLSTASKSRSNDITHSYLLPLSRGSGWWPHTSSLHSEDCGTSWWTIQYYILIIKQDDVSAVSWTQTLSPNQNYLSAPTQNHFPPQPKTTYLPQP